VQEAKGAQIKYEQFLGHPWNSEKELRASGQELLALNLFITLFSRTSP